MNLYQQRRSAGLCGNCGTCAPEAGKANCRACLDKKLARTTRLRGERVAAGLCPTCQRPGYAPKKTERQRAFRFGAAA